MIVQQWRKLGLSVFFDEDTIQPGEGIVTALDRAREKSRHTVLLITPESIASRWVNHELNSLIYLDPVSMGRRLVPVLLDHVAESKIPISVRRLNRIDLTDAGARQQESHRLLKSLGVTRGPLPDLPQLATSGAGPEAAPSVEEPVLELGAVPTDSPYYIERKVDRTVLRLLENAGATVTISGYRQSGKSSLLARLHAQSIQKDRSSCILDFKGMVPETFKAPKYFFPALAQSIADGLDLKIDPGEGWSPRRDEAQTRLCSWRSRSSHCLTGRCSCYSMRQTAFYNAPPSAKHCFRPFDFGTTGEARTR